MNARRPPAGRDDDVPAWVRGSAAARRSPSDRRAAARRAPAVKRSSQGPERRSPSDRRSTERRVRAARQSAKAVSPPGVAERRVLLFTTVLLLTFGLVMAYSASTAKSFFNYGSSFYFIERQAIFAALGIVAMIVLSRVDYVWWKRATPALCAIALASLFLVLVPGIGTMVNGARRWIIVAGFSYSPSELAKLAAVCLVAGLIVRQPRMLETPKGFLRLVVVGILPAAVLIMLEPDLGTTIILSLSVVGVLVAGGARIRHLGTLALVGLTGVMLMIAAEPYRMARLDAFLHPWKDPQGSGYQTAQSIISIASGHLVGVGLGNSVQKFGFLPEQTTDMITGIIGEELGLIGLLVLIALYVVLVWVVFRIALQTKEPFGRLLAVGIGCGIGGQAAINIGAALGMLPLTGVPLPLVSVGGTSLVVVLASVGIVANIATNRRSHIVASPEREKRARGGGGDRRAHDAGARRR